MCCLCCFFLVLLFFFSSTKKKKKSVVLSTNICCWYWFRKLFWLPANYALLWILAWVPTPYTGLCEAKLTQIQQRFQFLKFETIVSFSTTRLFTTLFLSQESTRLQSLFSSVRITRSQILKINLDGVCFEVKYFSGVKYF